MFNSFMYLLFIVHENKTPTQICIISYHFFFRPEKKKLKFHAIVLVTGNKNTKNTKNESETNG